MITHKAKSMIDINLLINEHIESTASEIADLFSSTLRHKSISGQEGPFVRFMAGWAESKGFAADLWQSSEKDVEDIFKSRALHIPLAGRPTLVINFPGSAGGHSVILNSHADVVDADPSLWSTDPWGGIQKNGRFYGRGACDAKGPLLGALWAMLVLKELMPGGLPGDIMLELIPGEEDCVGLGTSTSMARGYRADSAVILEPTNNLPYSASRSGVRFEVRCYGKSVHGTVKWLGTDAIDKMRKVLDALPIMETGYNDHDANPHFSEYPITRPITVDSVSGGRWQGMICDLCTCGGYFELLPDDDMESWKRRFEKDLKSITAAEGIEVRFSEEYQGHMTRSDAPLCRDIRRVLEMVSHNRKWERWEGFNSGCEAGVRANIQHTPTVVWGPGELAEAHSADESISFLDIKKFTKYLATALIYRTGAGF